MSPPRSSTSAGDAVAAGSGARAWPWTHRWVEGRGLVVPHPVALEGTGLEGMAGAHSVTKAARALVGHDPARPVTRALAQLVDDHPRGAALQLAHLQLAAVGARAGLVDDQVALVLGARPWEPDGWWIQPASLREPAVSRLVGALTGSEPRELTRLLSHTVARGRVGRLLDDARWSTTTADVDRTPAVGDPDRWLERATGVRWERHLVRPLPGTTRLDGHHRDGLTVCVPTSLREIVHLGDGSATCLATNAREYAAHTVQLFGVREDGGRTVAVGHLLPHEDGRLVLEHVVGPDNAPLPPDAWERVQTLLGDAVERVPGLGGGPPFRAAHVRALPELSLLPGAAAATADPVVLAGLERMVTAETIRLLPSETRRWRTADLGLEPWRPPYAAPDALAEAMHYRLAAAGHRDFVGDVSAIASAGAVTSAAEDGDDAWTDVGLDQLRHLHAAALARGHLHGAAALVALTRPTDLGVLRMRL